MSVTKSIFKTIGSIILGKGGDRIPHSNINIWLQDQLQELSSDQAITIMGLISSNFLQSKSHTEKPVKPLKIPLYKKKYSKVESIFYF